MFGGGDPKCQSLDVECSISNIGYSMSDFGWHFKASVFLPPSKNTARKVAGKKGVTR